jgi:putative intracellular protease/amidase
VRVLLPLPDRDFDVTEVAVPWAILRDAGHQVVFATEKAGTVPAEGSLSRTDRSIRRSQDSPAGKVSRTVTWRRAPSTGIEGM